MKFDERKAAHAVSGSTDGRREQVFTGLVSDTSVHGTGQLVKSARGKVPFAELTEGAPFSEGSGAAEFRAELETAAEAVKRAGVNLCKIKDPRARVLSVLRAVYFLGAFRGREAADPILINAGKGRFSLDGKRAKAFAGELDGLDSLTLEWFIRAAGL